MTWSQLRNWKYFWVVVGILALTFGYIIGKGQEKPTETIVKTIENEETKQKLEESLKIQKELREQLTIAEHKLSELSVRKDERVRIIYLNDGTKVYERETKTDIDKKTENNVETKKDTTEDIVVDLDKKEEKDTLISKKTETITKPLLKDDYYLGISGAFGVEGVSSPGVEFKYRFFDLGNISVWGGAEVIVTPSHKPDEAVQIRGGLGVSF